MHEPDWDGRFERTPGGPDFALANVPLMRLREVEIHHADLDAGYTAADWPEGFRVVLLDSMTKRSYPAPFTVRPSDLDRTWHYGDRERDDDGGTRRHRYVGRDRLVAHRPRHRRGPHDRQRHSPGGGVMVNESYTGEVSPGGDPDVRVLGVPDAHEGRRRPRDVQQLLPAPLRGDRRGWC